jgi:hypothetical protein
MNSPSLGQTTTARASLAKPYRVAVPRLPKSSLVSGFLAEVANQSRISKAFCG